MNMEKLRDFCLALPGATEGLPFGEETLVFKVGGKIFLLTSLKEESLSFNVKCDPEKAQLLRERYPFVLPGYHMNKKHWNTVLAGSGAHDSLYREWIRDSHALVVAGLSSKIRSGVLGDQN